MKRNLLILVLVSLIFVGCSTKRQYFEPSDDNISGKMSFNGTLPDNIKYVTKNGATLDNGNIISNNGLNSSIKLDKKEKFLGEYEGKFITTTIEGILRVRDSSGAEILNRDLGREIVSASIEGDDLALVTSENRGYLIKVNSNTIMMQADFGGAFAIDSRAAAPGFMGALIVYPTLDGKLVIVDRASASPIRDLVISNNDFFNNVIELKFIGDNMYAATASKITMISPSGVKNYSADIRSLIFGSDRIYLFKTDGVAEILDMNLNLVKKREFIFAILDSALISGNSLYIAEKTGYLLQSDLNLDNVKIYELGKELNKLLFTTKDSFYYNDEVLKF